jgi:23S rRNA pseudouridine1911/1915/1917 synthase
MWKFDRTMKQPEHIVEVPGRLDGVVRIAFELSRNKARSVISSGKITVDGRRTLDPATPMAASQKVKLDWNAPDPSRTEPYGVRLVHRDSGIIVIEKPAGLLSTPTGESERETALNAARKLCKGGSPPTVVHRLDRQTSGLMVFARGVRSARVIRAQMDAHEVRRSYRCVVQGIPPHASGLLSSMILRDAGEERRGSRRGTFKVRPYDHRDPGPMPGNGKLAITRFKVVARGEGRSAVEIRLQTGRTHQIRIHMAELGCPILGERVYARLGKTAPRQALHSAWLALEHPFSGASLSWVSSWPEDLANVTPIGSDW